MIRYFLGRLEQLCCEVLLGFRLSSGMSEVKVCTSSGQARAEVGMVSVQSNEQICLRIGERTLEL